MIMPSLSQNNDNNDNNDNNNIRTNRLAPTMTSNLPVYLSYNSSPDDENEEKEESFSRDNSGGNHRRKSNCNNNSVDDNYDGFPLVQSLMASEARRTSALTKEGSNQIKYPKSDIGWIRSLFVLRGRALDKFIVPWTIATLNAVAWAVVCETMWFRDRYINNGSIYQNESQTQMTLQRDYIENVLELVLTTTMAFLLVFRLNRSATRFWLARASWGIIIAKSRGMVGSILLHGSHDPYHRDMAVRWIAAFSIASMNHTRGVCLVGSGIDPNTLEGVLTEDELEGLNEAVHPPLHVADKVRFHMARLFGPPGCDVDFATNEGSSPDQVNTVNTANSSNSSNSSNNDHSSSSSHDINTTTARIIALSDFRTKQLVSLEAQLNVLIDEVGAMERIKGTPLPMVYVTHLRTWLMLYLLTLPYFWAVPLGYVIIPVECLVAFALLGVEGAASEVEAPFRGDRTNHLDMNSFCLTVLSNILQQVKDDACRRKTNRKRIKRA